MQRMNDDGNIYLLHEETHEEIENVDVEMETFEINDKENACSYPTELDLFDYPTTSKDRKRHMEMDNEDEEHDDISPPSSFRVKPDLVSSYQTPGYLKFRRRVSSEPKINYFEHYQVPRDVIQHIFSFLNKKDLCNAMATCSLFYEAGRSCRNWNVIDLHKRKIPDNILLRRVYWTKVKVLRLSDAIVSNDNNEELLTALRCSNIAYLDLGRAHFDRQHAMVELISSCRSLVAISFENIHFTAENATKICMALMCNHRLRFVDFSMTKGLTLNALKYLEGTRLEELNVSWAGLDSEAVAYLCRHAPPKLTRLNLAGTKGKNSITDLDIHMLSLTCPNIVELDLSDNVSLTDECIDSILNMRKLVKLWLSRCYEIQPSMFLQLENLSVLNVHGCLTSDGVDALRGALRNTWVNRDYFNYIAKPTQPPSVTSIWQMRTKDLY